MKSLLHKPEAGTKNKRLHQQLLMLDLQDICRQVESQGGPVSAGPTLQSAEEPVVSGRSYYSVLWKRPRRQQTRGQCRL